MKRLGVVTGSKGCVKGIKISFGVGGGCVQDNVVVDSNNDVTGLQSNRSRSPTRLHS